ncbi:MAG: MMPL family transporter [Magnetovibrionaceae bacterium]
MAGHVEIEIDHPGAPLDDGATILEDDLADATIAMDIDEAEPEPEPILADGPDGPDVATKGQVAQTSANEQAAKLLLFSANRPFLALVLALVLSVASAFGALQLTIDASYDSMYNKKDEAYGPYLDTIDVFGSDNITIIYLNDDRLFSEDRLLQIEDLTFALEDIGYVTEVESLFTVLNIRDDNGVLDLNPLMDSTPSSFSEIERVRDNALYSPLIRRNQLSDDGLTTAIIVTVEQREDDPSYNKQVFAQIEGLLAPLRADFDEVFQVGPPRLNVEIETGMFADMTLLTPIATVILVGSILFFLRTPMSAVLPLVTAGLSILWTVGFMGYVGIPVNLLTAILPSLIIVIGSTEDTHMLSSYLDGWGHTPPGQRATRYTAIRYMAVHVGVPVFLTSMTTAIGFLSNGVSDITLIIHFGVSAAFAMVANFVCTILVLPCLLLFMGPKRFDASQQVSGGGGKEAPNAVTDWIRTFFDTLGTRYPTAIAIFFAALAAAGAVFSTQIKVSNDPLSYFKEDRQIVQDAQKLHDDLAGMQVFYVDVAATPGKNFRDPEEMATIGRLVDHLNAHGAYDKVISIADYLRLVNREMNRGEPSQYKLPQTRALTDQYLLLFQRDDIDLYLSSDATRANIVVRHNISNSWELNQVLSQFRSSVPDLVLPGQEARVTGKNLLINKASEELFVSQVQSLGLLIAIIFIMMSILFTSLLAGLVSLVPNVLPIAILFGVMGLTGISLNPGTAIVAVIAVGIAIDDTIHLLTTYNAECRKDADQVAATSRTVLSEAVPVISTSISLAAGFAILQLSGFHIVAQFGILSAMTMMVAMLTDLLVTPVIMRNVRLVGIWDMVALKVGSRVLTESPLFDGMSKWQVRKFILLSRLEEFWGGEVIFAQDTEGRDLFVVIEGVVEVVHSDGRNRKILARRGPGEIIGELGWGAGLKRMATVRAAKDLEKAIVLRVETEATVKALRFYPGIRSKIDRNLNKILSKRLSETGKKLVHATR